MNKYQKIFGVGPFALTLNAVLLVLVWLLDRGLGGVRILSQPAPIRTIGLILIGIWACWHIWAGKTMRSWWSDDQLCTTGPFRFVRHPMYAGGLLLAGPGVALLFNSWIVLLWPILTYPVWSILVRKEEKVLTAFFGDKYKRYCAERSRFFPRFRF